MAIDDTIIHSDKHIKHLSEDLLADYHANIEGLCRSFIAATERLGSDSYDLSEYIPRCRSLADQVDASLHFRSSVLHPYITELQRKLDTGHNCHHCAHKCDVQHSLHLVNAVYQSREIRQTLVTIYEAFAIPDNIKQDIHFRQQRFSLMHLDISLTELFYMEELHLLPALVAAQKSINAGN